MKIAVFSAFVAAAAAAVAPQVNVTLYSESYCPDCVHFWEGVFWKSWNTQGLGYGTTVGDGQGIIAFNNVPYGNARISADNSTITCQHGANECLYNTLENCAIAHNPNPAAWMPFVYCVEEAISGGTISAKAAEKCATKAGVLWKTINTCWTGAEGHALDVAAAFATSALVPAHTFVPWVTLSDLPGSGTYCDENGCDGLVAAVCAAYTGVKPAACSAEALERPAAALRGAVPAAGGSCSASW